MRIFAALIVVFLANAAIAELQFPLLDADDLNGRAVSLPQDLPGDPTIVFIAYKRNQQPSINAWVARLGLQERVGAAWVELPVVGRGAALFRNFVDNGMRSGITSTAMRGRTITIYSSQRAFNMALGIDGRDDIYTALVGRDGQVYVLIAGDVTAEKMAQLRAAYP
ncbi:MAG: hypothetical protein ISP37_02740 [Planktomarina sp.]|uniref:hypothetical protein n=1 Tax=Planktomarina sp. TaxID=2024851 RepID=UPI003260337C|nr:hypothetical protein [Planktomarina sp.]